MDVKAIFCNSCGSTDVTFQTNTLCRCNHCGAKFIVEEESKTVINANNIRIVSTENELIYEENFFTFEKLMDEKEFYRKFLIRLANSSYTPTNVFEGSFSPLIEKSYFFTQFTCNNSVQYAVELGHNHEETYADRDFQGNPITRSRIVTHWFPNNGFFENTNIIITTNDDSKEPYSSNNLLYYRVLNNNRKAIALENANIKLNNFVTPDKNIKKHVLEQSKVMADDACKHNLVCDYYRNYSSKVKGNFSKLNHYVVNEYKVSYNLGSQQMTYPCLTCDDDLDYHSQGYITGSKAEAEATEQSKLLKKIAISLLLGFVLLCVVFLVLFFIFFKRNPIFFILEAPVWIAGIVFSILYRKRYNRVKSRILYEEKKIKIKELKNKLNEMSLRELSPEEERRI